MNAHISSPITSAPENLPIVRRLAAATANTAAWFGIFPQPVAHGVAVILAVALFTVSLVVGRSKMFRFLMRESSFWFGLLFLGYLSLQAVNSGREAYFDVGLGQWAYSPARWPNLPSSFDGGESISLFMLFLPAWTLVLVVRSPILGTLEVIRLLRTISYSSGVLAACGTVEYLSGVSILKWFIHASDGAFATMGYANHASAYFLLAAALSAGLLLREAFQTRRPVIKLRLSVLFATLISNLIAVNLSMSRAGILLSWALVVVMIIFALVHNWRTVSYARRVEIIALNMGLACLLFFTVSGWAGQLIAKEFRPRQNVSGKEPSSNLGVNLSMGVRGMLSKAALEIVRDNIWFGTGGWGFRYLASSYVPGNCRAQLQSSGKANVHCDALQFLSEFGLAGSVILIGVVARPLGATLNILPHRDPLGTMSACGLAMVAVWSFIDLPFRCPAILFTWAAMFASLPRLRI